LKLGWVCEDASLKTSLATLLAGRSHAGGGFGWAGAAAALVGRGEASGRARGGGAWGRGGGCGAAARRVAGTSLPVARGWPSPADGTVRLWVSDAAHEAMRDLVRARTAVRRVLGKDRQHLQRFLLRHGRIYRSLVALTLRCARSGGSRRSPGRWVGVDGAPRRRDRPGRHQRWTRTRVVPLGAGSPRTTMLILPPCSRSGSATLLHAAHRPRLGTLENHYSPLVHRIKCYTKPLKYRMERVRLQFLSVRQLPMVGTVSPALASRLKPLK
jgi:hypothetical protein